VKKVLFILVSSLINNIAIAATSALFMQPLIISCGKDLASPDNISCTGVDTKYLKVSGGDKTIPQAPISFYFSVAMANADGQPIAFIYHDSDLHYSAMLSPATALIFAKLDAPGWIISSTGSYYCSKESILCPVYSK
jgi:hypothetical protein